MAITTNELAAAWRAHPHPILADLMVKSLSPQTSQVLHIVAAHTGGITSMDVWGLVDRKPNHVTTILNRLYRWGLIGRRAVPTESGYHFIWWVNGEVRSVLNEEIPNGET